MYVIEMHSAAACAFTLFFLFPPRDGRSLPDDVVTGLMIGLLMAGQHTSSATSAWLTFFVARDKALQDKLYQEQLDMCGEDLPPLHYDQLKDLSLLERCIRETLRLRPPIMTIMRMVRTPQVQGISKHEGPSWGECCMHLEFIPNTESERVYHSTWTPNLCFSYYQPKAQGNVERS